MWTMCTCIPRALETGEEPWPLLKHAGSQTCSWVKGAKKSLVGSEP